MSRRSLIKILSGGGINNDKNGGIMIKMEIPLSWKSALINVKINTIVMVCTCESYAHMLTWMAGLPQWLPIIMQNFNMHSVIGNKTQADKYQLFHVKPQCWELDAVPHTFYACEENIVICGQKKKKAQKSFWVPLLKFWFYDSSVHRGHIQTCQTLLWSELVLFVNQNEMELES